MAAILTNLVQFHSPISLFPQWGLCTDLTLQGVLHFWRGLTCFWLWHLVPLPCQMSEPQKRPGSPQNIGHPRGLGRYPGEGGHVLGKKGQVLSKEDICHPVLELLPSLPPAQARDPLGFDTQRAGNKRILRAFLTLPRSHPPPSPGSASGAPAGCVLGLEGRQGRIPA